MSDEVLRNNFCHSCFATARPPVMMKGGLNHCRHYTSGVFSAVTCVTLAIMKQSKPEMVYVQIRKGTDELL